MKSGNRCSSASAIRRCKAWRGPRSRVVYAVSWTSVFEQIFGRRRDAALEDEAGFDEAAESLLQFGLGERSSRCQQLIGKVAPDCGAGLRHSLGRGAQPVEAPQQ